MSTPRPRQPRLESWAPAVAGEGVFSAEDCARIAALAEPEQEARLHGGDDHAGYRDSRVTWIRPGPDTEWIFARTLAFVQEANAAHFHCDLAGFTEPLQLAEYGPGQHYDWHLDIGNGPISIRKLSFIVQLTDPADYEGGAVEIMAAKEPQAMVRAQGAVVVFPSYILHRVREVTRGARRSLVGWIGGPHYR